MKTTGWVATAVGAVVVVGGGIWAATTLPADDETAYTGAYEPAITETPAASAEPTEPVETPAVEPEESTEPAPEETAAPEYTEAEQAFLPWARENYDFFQQNTPDLPELSDADLIDALHKACEVNGDESLGLVVIPGYDSVDDLDPDTWEDDANGLFFGAARMGDGAGMSYCG